MTQAPSDTTEGTTSNEPVTLPAARLEEEEEGSGDDDVDRTTIGHNEGPTTTTAPEPTTTTKYNKFIYQGVQCEPSLQDQSPCKF